MTRSFMCVLEIDCGGNTIACGYSLVVARLSD